MRPEIEQIVSYRIKNAFHDGWQPEHQVVDDVVFVKVDKYDTDFFRFCTGEPIRWGKKRDPQCHYFEFYESLMTLRNTASQDAFQKAVQEVRDAADQDADEPRKRQKIRKAKLSDISIAGAVVNVTLEFSGRQQASQMMFGCRGSPLYIRADPDSLGFIQRAIQSNFVANVPRPPRTSTSSNNADDVDGDNGENDDDGNDDTNDDEEVNEQVEASTSS